MTHKTRAEQLATGARKDPHKKARVTQIHRDRRKSEKHRENEILDEIDEFFETFDQPDDHLDVIAEINGVGQNV